MAEQFNVGDVVQLNSGGPVMTVQGLRAPDDVICVWFEKTKRHDGAFPAATLRTHKPSGPMVFSL